MGPSVQRIFHGSSGYSPRRNHNNDRSVLYLSTFVSSFLLLANAEMVCQKGVQNFAGVTYPPGDIILQEGDPLDVYCSVNLTHPKARGYNASHLEFVVRKHNIPEELIHREIVNETTIHMKVKNMNASIVYVDCVVRKEDGSSVQVCQNHVEVGYPPLPVLDFRCIAWNWTKLVCSWRKLDNPIPTKYRLSFITSLRSQRFEFFCPETRNHSNGTSSCEWNKHDPPYKPNEKRYYLKMNGTNALNKSGVTWSTWIDHFSIVIPEPPKIIIAVQSPYRLFVNWTFKNFEHFPPGLEHELSVCSEYEECNQTIFTTETSVWHVAREIQVPHAFTNYNVTVRLRSQAANKTDEFWSSAVSVTARTLAKAPNSPPRTNIGSFEIYRNKLQHRNIYVYWESIEPSKRNGPDLHYQVTLFEDGRQMDIRPDEINSAYAKFVNLSDSAEYRVEVFAVNEVGRSVEESTVVIPSSEKVPEEPLRVSRLDYANGTYEVSWTPPLKHENIVSYTVFRCNHSKPRPHQCNGVLKWDVVPAGKDRAVYNISNRNGEVVQFAVAANTEEYSSGMMWASCSLIPDKVPDKLKPVDVVEAKEDQLRIEWEMDCSYQAGVIDGFRIAYCRVDEQQTCVDIENRAFTPPELKTYTLKNLRPYSTYKIAISVQTKAGESQQSSPKTWRTSEAAPSDSSVLTPLDVRNTSISVLIQPPLTPNGKIRRYEVYVNSTGSDRSGPPRIFEVGNDEQGEKIRAELTDLESNTRYAIQVSACTIKCSEKSDPVYVTTKTGATNMRKFPTLDHKGGNLEISWHTPDHLGGPISRFEVMVKQNGEDANETHVKYIEGQSAYVKEMSIYCDSNTNFTAKVRAVTILDSGDEVFGSWSQEGYVACVGTIGWVLWVTLGVVLFFVVILLAFVVQKCWNCYIDCRYGIEPKLPPGLEKELYPCNPVPARRGNSMDDMQSYMKDNLSSSSPLKYISSTNIDEEQGILSSSQIQEEKGCLGDRRLSPSALNPLLSSSDRSHATDEEDYTTSSPTIKPENTNLMEEPYKKLGMFGNGHVVMTDDKSSGNLGAITPNHLLGSDSAVTPPTQAEYTGPGLDDVFSSASASTVSSLSEPQSPEKVPTASRIVPDVLTTNNASSYVRWTQLLPDFKNDAIANRQSSSYCQVGII